MLSTSFAQEVEETDEFAWSLGLFLCNFGQGETATTQSAGSFQVMINLEIIGNGKPRAQNHPQQLVNLCCLCSFDPTHLEQFTFWFLFFSHFLIYYHMQRDAKWD